MIHNRGFLIQFGTDVTQRALQLALEMYARVPHIPQSLFMKGLDIQVDDKYFGDHYRNGTLTSGKHKTEAMFWYQQDSIFVCCLHFLASWIGADI